MTKKLRLILFWVITALILLTGGWLLRPRTSQPISVEFWEEIGEVHAARTLAEKPEWNRRAWENIYAGKDLPVDFLEVVIGSAEQEPYPLIEHLEFHLRSMHYYYDPKPAEGIRRSYLSPTGKIRIHLSDDESDHFLHLIVEKFKRSQKATYMIKWHRL